MKNMFSTLNRVAFACFLLTGGLSVQAQTPPNIGDVLRQTQPPSAQPGTSEQVPAIGGLPTLEAPMKALPSGPKVKVQSIEFVGNREISSADLNALVDKSLGQEFDLSQLEAFAQQVTKHYRTQGYFVARAYVPAQELVGGQLKIRIVEGNYGEFKLTNKSLVNDEVIQAILDDVKHFDIVSLDTLERVMLIANDTPGARVTKADVMPGAKIGTSDFAVTTSPTAPYNGYALLDNYGSVYTGKNRVSVGLDINSPTGRGDRISLSGLGTDTGGILNGRAAYSALLAPNGLRGEVSATRTQYALGNTYSSLDAKGTADILDVTLTYPLLRITRQTVELSLNAATKNLEDKINSTGTVTPKTSNTLTAGVNVRDEGLLFGYNGLTQASLAVTSGHLRFKNDDALSTDAAGAKTAGDFTKVVFSVGRTNLLPENFTLNASLKVQNVLRNKNLDSSERMAVSGYTGVLAYPSGELIGSNAMLAKFELSRPLPSFEGLDHNWFTFYNYGQAKAAVPVSASDERRSISDVGFGWFGKYQGVTLKAHLSHRIQVQAPTSEAYSRNKLLLQMGYAF